MKIHIVQKGDTLWKIAKKYGVNFEELKKLNTQLSNPDMIMPGMKIKVPTTGGSIKKEAPMSGAKETKINMGAKKEMPKAEQPVTKEQQKPLPVVEAAPVQPVKQVPKAVAPKPVKQEKAKKPFKPKMPLPALPDIDINNYYLMNMVQQPAPQTPLKPKSMPKQPAKQLPLQESKPIQQKPIQQMPIQPQLPPKPKNILPEVKPVLPVKKIKELPKSELPVSTQQGGYDQPMYPNQPQGFYPVSPVGQGQGNQQGGYPQQQMQFPQGQGAQMPQFPHYGVAGVESPSYDESPYYGNQQLPHTNPMYTQPTEAQFPPQAQLPPQVGGAQEHMKQLPLQPTYTAPAMQQPYYPCPPYPAQLYPISPVMPGPGFGAHYPYGHHPHHHHHHHGFPQMSPMPQVQGMMEQMPGNAQMPLMPTESQMPMMPTEHQMPLMPTQAVQGDCGCGGPSFGPGYHQHGGFGPGYAPQWGMGAPGGFAPYQQMNPFGYGPMGGQAFGMPRDFDESSEYEG